DPPVHSRLRRLLVASFTPRVVERLRPRVEELIGDLLDDIDGPTADLLGEFAYPLPALVIGELLGVPRVDQPSFTRWSADLVAFVGTGATDPARAATAEQSMAEFRDYLRPLIGERRQRPSDDLVGLLAAPSRDVDRLTDDELIATCVTLLFAGHETTANLIGNGLLALLRHPEQLALLHDDASLMTGAVEELLRYDSPVQRNRRRATGDVELDGKHIRQDDRVLAFLGAANRDPGMFDEPDRLDVRRAAGRHMAFGHGIHYCVGAALSRLEAPIALDALLRRWPRMALADEPIRWKPNIAFRGLEELRVTLD
ncbi:MAG: cytochrome P450, partial [Chloroflexi bacterium]|nr:cytochrome P450 [Chloroflexota bacterium]